MIDSNVLVLLLVVNKMNDRLPKLSNINLPNPFPATGNTKIRGLQSNSIYDCSSSSKRKNCSRKRAHQGSDVWYRHVLTPLLVGRRAAAKLKDALMKETFGRDDTGRRMKDEFAQRVNATHAGVPADAFPAALHDACAPKYSPFVGLLFANNHSVENLYRYGDPEDPLVKLVHHLFHMIPGGEIQPTHVHRNATAHLSPAVVGALLEEYLSESEESEDEDLAARFLRVISEHEDYKEGRKEALDALEKALQEQQDLTKKDEMSKPHREEIKRIEGTVIKHNRNVLKRMSPDEGEEKRRSIESLIEEGQKQVDELRSKYIVTSGDKKAAKKAVQRAEEALDLQQENLKDFTQVLAYNASAVEEGRPHITTMAILLAFMWRKYNHISSLAPYFHSLSRAGELRIPLEETLLLLNPDEDSEGNHAIDNSGTRRFRVPRSIIPTAWPAEKVVEATTIVTTAPSGLDRPPVIPFSYVTWAAYSKFPDCAEVALRNLMNQVVFRADLQRFDVDLLVELKEKYYPDLSPKLIQFYQDNNCPRNVRDPNVSLEWIDVVSMLNSALGIIEGPQIRYRREDTEQNIASPLANLMKVLSALFGITPLDDMAKVQLLIDHINELRPQQHLTLDMSALQSDGFGILRLTVVDHEEKTVNYELHSYKPVHFGFLQVHSSSNDSSDAEDYEYDAFKKLMHYASGAHSIESTIEDLGLASLFVPYQLRYGFVGKYFRKTHEYYPLIFADLEDESAKQSALQWARERQEKTKDVGLAAWISRIENYVEPSFGPIRESSEN